MGAVGLDDGAGELEGDGDGVEEVAGSGVGEVCGDALDPTGVKGDTTPSVLSVQALKEQEMNVIRTPSGRIRFSPLHVRGYVGGRMGRVPQLPIGVFVPALEPSRLKDSGSLESNQDVVLFAFPEQAVSPVEQIR